MAAALWRYAGPGQWNDPGMLVHQKSGMTDAQTRTQVNMYAVLPAQLMIGIDIRNASAYLKETLLNKVRTAACEQRFLRHRTRHSELRILERWAAFSHPCSTFRRSWR